MRKTLYVIVWFQAAMVVLLLNVSYLSATRRGSLTEDRYSYPFEPLSFTLQENRASGKVLGTSVTSEDARTLILTAFIDRYQKNSPMRDYATSMVKSADTYGLDFRLVPAIAMCESNLGVRIPSKDSYNAWGIAVYTGQNHGKKFTSWDHAIDWVSSYINTRFIARGITDLRDIGAIWAPPSVEKEYSWTRCVESFMERMQ